jgi:hypothetical protein
LCKRKNLNNHAVRAIRTLDESPSIFIIDKPIFSSERVLNNNYCYKISVEKKSLVVSLKGLDAKMD